MVHFAGALVVIPSSRGYDLERVQLRCDAPESGDGMDSGWALEVGFSVIYLSNTCQR